MEASAANVQSTGGALIIESRAALADFIASLPPDAVASVPSIPRPTAFTRSAKSFA